MVILTSEPFQILSTAVSPDIQMYARILPES